MSDTLTIPTAEADQLPPSDSSIRQDGSTTEEVAVEPAILGTTTAYEDLMAAAQVMRSHGWTHGTLWDGDDRVCAVGSFVKLGLKREGLPVQLLAEFLIEAGWMAREVQLQWGPSHIVAWWNDQCAAFMFKTAMSHHSCDYVCCRDHQAAREYVVGVIEEAAKWVVQRGHTRTRWSPTTESTPAAPELVCVEA